MARFCPLFSGSKGNSWYIGSGSGGVLIDAGVSAKRLDGALDSLGVTPNTVHGIFVTHEHTDHINGLRVFASRHNIPVFTSAGTLSALTESGVITPKVTASAIDENGVSIGDMYIRPFRTSHDCRESFGYIVQTADGQRASVCTDLGEVTPEVLSAVTGCDLVVMESNHDVHMLQNGPYPYTLKRRILSSSGHLSNDSCADTLVRLLQSGTRRFFLGHLSAENNNPHLAKQTSVCALTMAGAAEGKDYLLQVAPKDFSGQMTVF